MKEFMMVFIGEDYEDLGLSPEQLQERMGKWFVWGEKMKNQGIIKSGEALHAAAKTISGPDRIVTDGPYTESKEMIGGYYVVSAESFDEVVKIAQDFPDYDLGSSVEIREVMKFEE
ncbi:YciI family protein [Algoriphagus aquimarinus]|uniref:YciI family protein n=1 Tax=Algoriphagus aquimarinus TaxID=237018 RepID=UPI0030DD5078|tara:strand:+ start:192552 stop:192899 length:348 start_codon:yes stop_codon:yes gene_type:complete